MSQPARLSRQARREVAEALREIDQSHVQLAFRAAIKIVLQRLGKHPDYGRVAPSYVSDTYRFWSMPRFGYIVVYDPRTEPVEILRFVHARRDLPRVLANLR